MTGVYTFEDDFDIVRFERCAVSVHAKRQVLISETDALMILQRSFELTDYRQYVVFVGMSNIRHISPEARRILSSARNVLAAVMVGSELLDRMLAAPYESATYPCEYFTDERKALQRLALVHDMVCTDPVEHTMGLTVDLDPFRSRKAST